MVDPELEFEKTQGDVLSKGGNQSNDFGELKCESTATNVNRTVNIPSHQNSVQSIKTETSCLVFKLETVCKEKRLKIILEEMVDQVNRASLEAHQFLNFHMLRLLQSGEKLPNLSQTFLANVIVAVTGNEISELDEVKNLDQELSALQNAMNQKDKDLKELRQNVQEIKSQQEQNKKGNENEKNNKEETDKIKILTDRIETIKKERKVAKQKWNKVKKSEDFPKLKESVKLWMIERKRDDILKNNPLPNLDGINQCKAILAARMETMCNNLIEMNFLPRLLKYIRKKYPQLQFKDNQQAWTLIYQVFPEYKRKPDQMQPKKTIKETKPKRLLKYGNCKEDNGKSATTSSNVAEKKVAKQQPKKSSKNSTNSKKRKPSPSPKLANAPKKSKIIQTNKRTNNKRAREEQDQSQSQLSISNANSNGGNVWSASTTSPKPALSEEELLAFRNWLQFFPSDHVIKNNHTHFFKLMYDILCFFDNRNKAVEALLSPEEKAARRSRQKTGKIQYSKQQQLSNQSIRLFSMLPLQKGFQLKNIQLDTMACQLAVQKMLNKFKNQQATIQINGKHYSRVNRELFFEKRDEIWRTLFKVKSFETKNRKFAYCIDTNGYSCSLHFTKPSQVIPVDPATTKPLKPEEINQQQNEETSIKMIKPGSENENEIKCSDSDPTVEQKPNERARKESAPRKKRKDPYEEEEMKPEKIEESEYFNYTYYSPESLQNDFHKYQFKRLVACDPGISDLLTFIDQTKKISRITLKEYRHLSQMDKQSWWNNNIRKRFPEYKKVIDTIPCLLTPDPDLFLRNAMLILKHRDYLFDFHKQHAFRKWRFKVRIYSQKAMATFCKRITQGLKREEVLIGMGDWSRDPTTGFIRGHEPAPVLKLKRALLQYAIVVRIHEFRTSVACHVCGSDRIKPKLLIHESKKNRIKRLKQEQLDLVNQTHQMNQMRGMVDATHDPIHVIHSTAPTAAISTPNDITTAKSNKTPSAIRVNKQCRKKNRVIRKNRQKQIAATKKEKVTAIENPNKPKSQHSNSNGGVCVLCESSKKCKTSIQECYKVLCCTNTKCPMRYQQRDRNSAYNHMKLLECIIQRQDRPSYLSRPSKKEQQKQEEDCDVTVTNRAHIESKHTQAQKKYNSIETEKQEPENEALIPRPIKRSKWIVKTPRITKFILLEDSSNPA